jgi:hypothetical protein
VLWRNRGLVRYGLQDFQRAVELDRTSEAELRPFIERSRDALGPDF